MTADSQMQDALTNLATDAAQALRASNATVAVTESSTGGLISAALVAIPGASEFYVGGSVVYSLPSRRELLRISRADVGGAAVLSEAMALAFAEHARAQLDTTWAIAELGVAGPSGSPYGHPAGTCVIGVAGPRQASLRIETNRNHREQNMWRFASEALHALAHAITTT